MKLITSFMLGLCLVFSHSVTYGADKYANGYDARKPPISSNFLKESFKAASEPVDRKPKGNGDEEGTSGCPQSGSGVASSSPSC